MRKVYRRMALGLLVAGLGGSAALGLGGPAGPPPLDGPTAPPTPAGLTAVPTPAPADPEPKPAVRPAAHTESASRNDPAVALEWGGPPEVRVRRPNEYTLTVRNTCGQPVQKVTVQVRVPKDAAVSGTEPAATVVGGVYVWDVGTLEPRAAKPLKLTLTPAARGELGCQAWVTFTGTAGMTVVAREPKLEVRITAPETVPLGDPIKVTYTVTNVGDCPVEHVQTGLKRPGQGVRECRLYVVGGGLGTAEGILGGQSGLKLIPGETYSQTFDDAADKGGELSYTVTATGEDNVAASGKAKVRVLVPKLEATVTGPEEVRIGRKATYSVQVKNAGELPLDDMKIGCTFPDGLRATVPGTVPGSEWRYAPGSHITLRPGETKTVTVDLLAVRTGSGTFAVTATGSRDTKATAACRTVVEGIPAMRMEVSDLTDPVEKGGEAVYEVRVTSTGSKAEAGVVVACDLPPELEYVSATGPVKPVPKSDGKRVTRVEFEPVTELAPKTEAVFRVKVRATWAGDVRFKATLTSKHLSAPVTKEESTRVYGE